MKYFKVEWHHDFTDEPKITYSEIDSDGYEFRKIEVFPDDSYGFASANISSSRTFLSDLPFPEFNELTNDEQFKPSIINKEEFETVWSKAVTYDKPLLVRFINYIKTLFSKKFST